MDKLIAFLKTALCIITVFCAARLPFCKTDYTTAKSQKPILNAVLVADMHTDGNPVRDRNNEVREIFGGIGTSKAKVDALVIAGDITNSGADVEYTNLERMIRAYSSVGQILPQMGNHDSHATSDSIDFTTATVSFQNFLSFCKIKTDRNYYSKEVNGVTFIMLATEKTEENETNKAFYTQEQMTWLDGELKKASENVKPVFVISHQPLKGFGGNDFDYYNGVGSDVIKETIKRYTDGGMTVVFVSGHTHLSMSENTLTHDGSFYHLNLPSVLYSGTADEFTGNGVGAVAEVYDESIIIRARSFTENKWIENFNFEITY